MEKVRRKSNDPLDQSVLHQVSANVGFLVAPEKHSGGAIRSPGYSRVFRHFVNSPANGRSVGITNDLAIYRQQLAFLLISGHGADLFGTLLAC